MGHLPLAIASTVTALFLGTLSTLIYPEAAYAESCVEPTEVSQPSSENRRIELEDWQIIFSLPENYRTYRTPWFVQIFPPEYYDYLHCNLKQDPNYPGLPGALSIALVDGDITEADVRQQTAETGGLLLGTVEMINDIAFVHTSPSAMTLSLPTGQGVSFILTAPADSEGNLLYPEAFRMVTGTFMFSLGWYTTDEPYRP
ncbi:MAG: hypothetical protein AAFP03_04455 [Cyanobacteria bacterium J06598_3]